MIDKQLINNILTTIIEDNEKYTNKCQPEYITTLPYDLRTNDINKLNERKNTIETEIQDRTNLINELKEENKEKGKNIKEGYDEWINALKDFHKEIPYTFDVDQEDQEDINALKNNLKTLINKAEQFKKELHNNIKTNGAEKDIGNELEEILWEFKNIEINNITYNQVAKYIPSYKGDDDYYTSGVEKYVSNIYKPINTILGNLRYKNGYQANSQKIQQYNNEIQTLTTELTRTNNKINTTP